MSYNINIKKLLENAIQLHGFDLEYFCDWNEEQESIFAKLIMGDMSEQDLDDVLIEVAYELGKDTPSLEQLAFEGLITNTEEQNKMFKNACSKYVLNIFDDEIDFEIDQIKQENEYKYAYSASQIAVG